MRRGQTPRHDLSVYCERGGEGSDPFAPRGLDVPTVLRWGPYRAFFYSNEGGEPAHVHVRAGSKEAKFWLHDLTVAVNIRFSSRELSDIIPHLRSHRDELLEAWDDYFWKLRSAIWKHGRSSSRRASWS